MADLLELAKAAMSFGPPGVFCAVCLWLLVQARKELAAERARCEALTFRFADTGDKMATAMLSSAVATEGLREVVRAATPR